MSDAADLTYEMMKRLHGEFAEFRQDIGSMKLRMSSVEQHIGALTVDVARINADIDDIRTRLGRIEKRLDLVEV
jgi:septal ring factor EnvC (AmiA/AmiB activator)